MQSYDDVEGFINYTDKDEWRKYIETYVLPLWNYSWILKEYWNQLREDFHGLLFEEVREEDIPLLLGGVIEGSERYTKNSLAKFYAQFFGMRIKDIGAWLLQSRRGEKLTNITVEVVETDFIKFVKTVFKILEVALSHQRLVTNFKEPELNYEELKRNSEKVKQLIKNFYQSLLNIALNYNYGTFFLCSINQVPYHYMKAAYPRIDEILDFLRNEFGLTELTWNNPIKPNTKTYKDYTIYCFPEYNPNNKGKSFGGAICVLNDLIWDVFSSKTKTPEALSMLFVNVPNLKVEFKQRIKGKVPEIYFDNVHYDKDLVADARKMHIDEGFLERYKESLLDILDENAPHLFLNMLKISEVSGNYIDFDSQWW